MFTMATLRTGAYVPMAKLVATQLAIRELSKGSPGFLAIADLRYLADNPSTVIGENSARLLRNHALLREDGTVHKDIAQIIIAATELRGDMVSLANPIASEMKA